MPYDRNPLYDMASDTPAGVDDKSADPRPRAEHTAVHERGVDQVPTSVRSDRPSRSARDAHPVRHWLIWALVLTIIMWGPYWAMHHYGVLTNGGGFFFLLIGWVLAILSPKP